MKRLHGFLLFIFPLVGMVLGKNAEGAPIQPSQTHSLEVPDVRPFPSNRYHLFHLSLVQVLEKTGAHSPEIRVIRKKLGISYALRTQAIESFFPSITASFGTMTYSGEIQNTGGQFGNIGKQQANLNHGAILIDQPGVSGFQTVVRTTRIEQTRSQLSETINQKSAQAARLYFENLASLSRVAVLRNAVGISRRILTEEKKLMELGGASIVGVLRAAHEVARDSRHLVGEEKRTYRIAFRLSQIMGVDANTLPVPDEPFILPRLYIRSPDDLDRLLELSDQKRPLLREFEKNRLARTENLYGTIYAPFVPTIGVSLLNGSLGPNFNSFSGYNQTLFFALWTIGPGGIFDPAAINLAQKQSVLARALLDRTRIRVHRQVREAFEQVRKSLEEEKISVNDMELAKMTFLASRRRVQLGVYHSLELIISLRDLVNAQLHYINATQQLEESQFDLLAAIGTQPEIVRTPVPVGPPVQTDLFQFGFHQAGSH
ncbi:MAG: TolC family protein [Leptospirales bacterium]